MTVADKAATCTISSGTYKLHVTAAANRAIASARLYWIEGNGPRHSLPMAVTNARTAEVTKVLLRETAVWWVRAVALDGTEADTSQLTVRNPCV